MGKKASEKRPPKWKFWRPCHICGQITGVPDERNRFYVCAKCRETVPNLSKIRGRLLTLRSAARRKNVECSLTLRQTLRCLEFWEFKCAYCGADYEELDHIVPVSAKGGLEVHNILPICVSCNRKKWMRVGIPVGIPQEFAIKIKAYFGLPALDNPPYRNQPGWLGGELEPLQYLPFDDV